jgi:hypothetical protein
MGMIKIVNNALTLLSFGRGAPKSTTQGVILTTLPLATFQLFNSTSIDEYRWREQVIPHRMMVASL